MVAPRARLEAVHRALQEAWDRSDRRISLKSFVKGAYKQLQAGVPLQWGWYLDAICDFLQAQLAGEIKWGIINVRNRSLKSTVASICLHPWAWLTRPGLRFFTGGYDGRLAVEHSWKSRQLIDTPWYQSLKLTDWALADDMNKKAEYSNTLGGHRLATQVGGGTGHGGHVFVIDDPLSIDQSYSDAANEEANRWFFETVLSRLDDPRNSIVSLVQHRLRQDDTTGIAMATKEYGFTQLELPLEYDPRRQCTVPAINFEDPRTEPGEILCPERWPPEIVERDKTGPQGHIFEALCNQNPSKRESTLIKEHWIRRYRVGELPPLREMKIVQSWDLSFKGQDPTAKSSKKRSKTGGLVIGIKGGCAYVIDRFCQHADWLQQKDAVRLFRERWPATAVTYVEDEANGSAMALELGREIPGIVPVHPGRKGGKWQRLAAVAPFFRAGNIWIPSDDVAAWGRELVTNLCGFPNMPHDEDPDCVSQALSEEWLPASAEKSPEDHARMIRSIRWGD